MARAQALGLTVRERSRLEGLDLTVTRFALPPELDIAAAARALRAEFPGLLVDENTVYRTQSTPLALPADHPARLLGWSESTPECGAGVVIGLVDTGVDAAVVGGVIEQRSFVGDAELAPPGHGTGTAALLVGAAPLGLPGLVPGAGLRVAAVFQMAEDGGAFTTASSLAAALDWLVGSGITLVNLSLAGGDNALLRIAVERAVARRTVLVAAAGNGGADAGPAFPAAYPGVLAVTAVDRSMVPFVAANRGDYIDLAAPGVDIPTVEGSTIVMRSGTSYAAPFVTALLATMGAATPGATEAEAWLESGARDLGAPGRDEVYGWGLATFDGGCTGSN